MGCCSLKRSAANFDTELQMKAEELERQRAQSNHALSARQMAIEQMEAAQAQLEKVCTDPMHLKATVGFIATLRSKCGKYAH